MLIQLNCMWKRPKLDVRTIAFAPKYISSDNIHLNVQQRWQKGTFAKCTSTAKKTHTHTLFSLLNNCNTLLTYCEYSLFPFHMWPFRPRTEKNFSLSYTRTNDNIFFDSKKKTSHVKQHSQLILVSKSKKKQHTYRILNDTCTHAASCFRPYARRKILSCSTCAFFRLNRKREKKN